MLQKSVSLQSERLVVALECIRGVILFELKLIDIIVKYEYGKAQTVQTH